MYEQTYGLSRMPFSSTLDSSAYYPSTGMSAALQDVISIIDAGSGFAIITGSPGIGKTMLAKRILDYLHEDHLALWIANTHFESISAFFQAILYDLGQPYEGKTEQELRLHLVDSLVREFEKGRKSIIVIDEAHHLSVRLLEELRMLGNLENSSGKVVQFVLFGEPELLETLAHKSLRSLAQRISCKIELGPIEVHEAADYLIHRIRAAGGCPEQIITDEAVEIISKGIGGVPRMLNQAADIAFRLGHAAEQESIDAEAAMEALAELGISSDPGDEEEDQEIWPAEQSGPPIASVAPSPKPVALGPKQTTSLAEETSEKHTAGAAAGPKRPARLVVQKKKSA